VNQVVSALMGQLSGESLNGQITGGAIYFGHSGPGERAGVLITTALFVGQTSASGTNIDGSNYYLLGAARTANILGPNASMEINGCEAGTNVADTYTGRSISIAQLIADELAIPVKAYNVGMYFSNRDAAHDQNFVRTDNPPETLPMYMIPIGPKGQKPSPITFYPQR
jgi:hypothetical protein